MAAGKISDKCGARSSRGGGRGCGKERRRRRGRRRLTRWRLKMNGKMHINNGLVKGLNILILWSKLIRCRSFFKYMLLYGTFGSVHRKSYVESAGRI
jgi:hypothetical protein